ncbi:MAG: endonuclease NucS [Actinomycetes bacterium]
MRLVIARCTVDYTGRLQAHLPMATRLVAVKADGTVLVHADTGSKPLNWMAPPARWTIEVASDGTEIWTVVGRAGEELTIRIAEVLADTAHELGAEPGLAKDGVERQLQVLLAEQVQVLGDGWSLVDREYETGIGPVDLLCRDHDGRYVAVEIKRRGEISGLEQLSRYLVRLTGTLGQVRGVLAAQRITAQARTLAADRGIRCVTLDYEELRGMDPAVPRLF